MKHHACSRMFWCSLVTVAVVALEPQSFAQEERGVFVDGEYVEGYEYAAEFMPPDELTSYIDRHSDEVIIIDTAAPAIFEEEHIPGAVNFPWVHELTPPLSLPHDKTLVLYCACKNHEDSVDMAGKLNRAGYYKVKVLEGGWFKWLDLGYATAGADAAEARDGEG